jgi:hypothetical protein
MSAFMVSNHLMQKVVTAVLQNTDEFATIQTFRGRLVDDPPTDGQCKAAEDIGKRLFSMNAAAIKARYSFLPQRPVFKFAGWAAATPVEQFKAIRCLLYQSCEGTVPNGRRAAVQGTVEMPSAPERVKVSTDAGPPRFSTVRPRPACNSALGSGRHQLKASGLFSFSFALETAERLSRMRHGRVRVARHASALYVRPWAADSMPV